MFFKEINYKYLYGNTIKFIILRKYKKNFIELFNFKLFFWYRRLQFEDVTLLKLYNNLIFFRLLFKQNFILEKMGSTLKRGIYYYRLVFFLKMSKNNDIFKYLDVFLNGILPVLRKDTMSFYNVNDDLMMRLKDLSFFSNIRIGDYYYIEHITDNVYIQYSFKHFNVKKCLNLFKFDIKNGV
jgi:hypothetical protein